MKSPRRRAFTLVELLVVIAIIGILIMMLLPAINAAREAARKMSCMNNLNQLGIALQNYEAAHEALPAGVTNPDGPIHNVAQGNHMSWLVQLLPYIDERVTYEHVDFAAGAYAKQNEKVRAINISLLRCPSSASAARCLSDYAGCHHDVEAPIAADNHGVLFLNSHITAKDVTDGPTHTIYVGEKLQGAHDLGWMSGTRATLRNTGTPLNMTAGDLNVMPLDLSQWTEPASKQEDLSAAEEPAEGEKPAEPQDPGEAAKPAPPSKPAGAPSWPAAVPSDLYVGGFGSDHPAVVNFLFGDGAVHSVQKNINPRVLRQLGHRADGQLLTEGPTREQ
jgi:prepilin-type N-terminal cleavage/methylation domain-containing protein